MKEEDFVLCTVKRMEGTTVFLEIEGNGEGTLAMSEIAAGRIRNIREYVSPNKKIVCKVLKIINGHPQLSLRRVTTKEKEEVLDKYEKEKTFFSLSKSSLKNPQEFIDKIKTEYELADFLDQIKENPKILEKYLSGEELELFQKRIIEKKEKDKIIKKVVSIKSNSEAGINEIKDVLKTTKDKVEIRYLGSSQFSISISGKDFKDLESQLSTIISEMEKKAKDKKLLFELKK